MPRLANQAIKAELFSVVASMGDVHSPGFSRSEVVLRFCDSGVSQATLFRWVKEAVEASPPSEHERAAPVAPEPTAQPPGIITPLVAPSRMVSLHSGQEILWDNHRRLDATIAMAETEDGRIRNPRLLLAAVAERRKNVATENGIRDAAELNRFLEALITELKKEVSADTWERIVVRLRAVNARYGV